MLPIFKYLNQNKFLRVFENFFFSIFINVQLFLLHGERLLRNSQFYIGAQSSFLWKFLHYFLGFFRFFNFFLIDFFSFFSGISTEAGMCLLNIYSASKHTFWQGKKILFSERFCKIVTNVHLVGKCTSQYVYRNDKHSFQIRIFTF